MRSHDTDSQLRSLTIKTDDMVAQDGTSNDMHYGRYETYEAGRANLPAPDDGSG